MRRVVSMWFPNWPVQRLRIERPDSGSRVLLVTEVRGTQRVVAHSPEVARDGISVGMSLADARALAGDGLNVVHHDPAGDAAALKATARWCHRFSPTVGLDGSDGLLLDVSGCTHLHGGERPMLHAIRRAIERIGLRSRLTIADTVGSAWGMCHFGRADVVPPGAGLAPLRRLAIEALRLCPETVATLRKLGVTTVGLLERLPRTTLPARFGPEIARRFDEVCGRRSEMIVSVPPLEPLRAARSFEPPLSDRRHVESVAGLLLDPLLDALRSRREGVVRLGVRLEVEEGRPVHLEITCVRSLDSAERLRRLLALRLERTGRLRPVGRIVVEIVERAPVGWRKTTLFGEDARDSELGKFVERVVQRLGERCILRPIPIPDPLPELACRFVSAVREEQGDDSASMASPTGLRPASLLPDPIPISEFPDDERPPERFSWQGRTHVVERWWGPERIATGWWRGRSIRRDYYRVETRTGHRFWLFRCDRSGAWFLHGVFD